MQNGSAIPRVDEVDITDYELAKLIHAVQLSAYAIESRLLGYPDLPPLKESAADLQASAERFLVCRFGDEVVGALSFLTHPEEVEICRLVVSPGHMRKGIAGCLLDGIEKLSTGFQMLTVATAKNNIPALRLYEKHGYRIVRDWQTSDGLELVQLRKAF